MSTSSRSRGINRGRVQSLQQAERVRRHSSYSSKKRLVTIQEAYTYAVRAAYLAHLLQPRAKRVQHVPATPRHIHRSSTNVSDLLKDFSLIRDSKSTRFPHGFVAALDKRLTGVLIGKEKHQEFGDPLVKRTFAAFLNEFKNPSFRKSMEKDRRVEDLILIFFSNATKELSKGKEREDDGWKLMTDRHVALFCRLINFTLKDHDWARDRPELTVRLQTMEKKLLMHDQDLAAESQRNGGAGGSTIEVEVPRSTEVKDMPMVLLVGRIFGISYAQLQDDITNNKDIWTEKAALQDLKTYQTHLSLNTNKTLNSEDFDTEEAYEAWRKTETPDLSQMILAIIQSNPELAKSAPGGQIPQFKPGGSADSTYAELSRRLSEPSDGSYVIDQPVDMGSAGQGSEDEDDTDSPYVFIPPDPREYFRAVLKECLSHDLADSSLQPTEATSEIPSIRLLSKESAELLGEIGARWRVPQFSRLNLMLDVIREKYSNHEIDLDTLDAAFNYIKEPPVENKKSHRMSLLVSNVSDKFRWTVHDIALRKKVLNSLHDVLLRELFEAMLLCYDTKPPPLGPIMYILDTHIYDDDLFSKEPEDLDAFTEEVKKGLQQRAEDVYRKLLADTVPDDPMEWEFYHVIELGKKVLKQCEKVQKRYRKNPEIMGVNPFQVFVEVVLPMYASDARDLVSRIMELAKSRGEEIPQQDGFDLYHEMTGIRQIHAQALPGTKFAFEIEDLLQDFVWRWIASTDELIIGWVENAVKQDQFQVQTDNPNHVPPDDLRHSVSVMDIFQSFNQAIETIVGLNWDNDFHYAKFMTAISKSVGKGISRYCELLEQQFTREMDRMTPEQEAAARRTRQEKWLQMAKDTWNKNERIEPFQFYPESLVKLNNIEYAMLQLDKLEKEVNVDACAEVIQRYTPPVHPRQRGPTNYVFTIKIIEAEDLKACDINGLSDPYVVLGDEYQKRLAKTRVVYGSLNPRWDETVDITTQGPLNIIATIWDWDTLGDHDCVGRTSLKLDPSHFRDFMPREYWLDLDTQGRLLLRVSMEGERDDIQFYFGKAFRTLKRTERDMTRQITDKLSAYIHHCLSRRALKSLLSRGLSIASVSSYFQRNRPQSVVQPANPADVSNALKPLFDYFNDNFALMKETLTEPAMVMVMTRLWKEVLATIESLLVPPLSDKLSQQRPLTQQELDIVFKWLQMLFDFFHAVDEETGVPNGVPLDILKSPKYHDLQNLNFFYFESTENLIRTSEAMASATANRQQAEAARMNRQSAPAAVGTGGYTSLLGVPTRRHKTIMLSRNLGTMRKAKEEKRKEAQAEPNDDIILRILRMRPEAERYLKDRSRQKERLAAAAAAEMIVKQSLNAQAGRMMGALPMR